MVGKQKTKFLVIVDKRIDNILRKEAMKKGLGKCALIRHIFNQYAINEGYSINDILNQIP